MTENREVVISGIGGRFPECNNMEELKDLLFNKTNGVTIDSRRWNPNEISGIDGTGKLKNIDKFDATFFSIHRKLAETMDPLTRVFLERSIEAIIDAGLNPSDLYGTNTAVFTGSAISVTEMYTMDCSENCSFSMLGRSRTMQANRISYILNLTGPSFSMDGGWICGSNGLEKAKEMIENGIISSAIIGVTSLVLRPEIQLQFQGFNRLNKNTQTKSFSSDADGYNRSEACIVMLLQRASEAKRSYGTLLSVKSAQFGDHQGHLVEHAGNNFKSVLLESYKEANINPASIEFVETYGSGIKSEDAMELNIMEEVFCTENRKIPLKVGSVKSNVGHCEVAGLFMSIVKAIIALESGYIPPNINYTEPNENVAALKNGKIQVVTEKTPLSSDVIGISSFGLINAFSHVIIRQNSRLHCNFKDAIHEDYIPRIIFVSGRNEENVRKTLDKIKSYGSNTEFIALTNDVFTKNINAHFYRSFSIFPNTGESRNDDVWNVDIMKKRQVWFIFSGMGSQWHGMGTDLMKLPIFANAINKCDIILKPLGVDIKHILTSQDPKIFDNILNSFVGIAAVQIGLVEVLKEIDIIPDKIIGHSVGELGCAYADGCFTAEEMILSAYARGRASLETELIPGMMAAIGLGYDQIKDKLPHDIDVACHNSATNCTISGPVDSINKFVSELKSEGVFAKAVNVAGIAFHSRYIQSAGPTLLKYLKDVIKVPKIRSSKWISSSLPETEWKSDLAKYSSPEYHTNNLLSSVLFEKVLKHIPSDAITIEIAPHGLLQAILKVALPNTVTNIALTKKVFSNSKQFLLAAFGKMYVNGLNPRTQKLYPPIKFPVSRGTPHIHSLPFWDHIDKWTPVVAKDAHLLPGEKTNSILLNDNIYLMEYKIHGYHIIPFAYVLINVWKMYVEMYAKNFSEESVQFYNLKFKNNIKIHPTNLAECYIMIQWGSGLFEYCLNDEVIFSGQISFKDNLNLIEKPKNDKTFNDFQGCISNEELYFILKKNGYNLGDNFKNITHFNVYKNNIQGFVKWENDWIYFLDGLLKFPLLDNIGIHQTEAPVSIRQLIINPIIFNKYTTKDININYNKVTNEITCNGVQICGVINEPIIIPILNSAEIKLEEVKFIPFNCLNCKNISEIIYDFMNIITESEKNNVGDTSGKFILYKPFHYNDPLYISCTKLIEQIIENEISIDSIILNCDNVEEISKNYEFGRFITVTNVDYFQDTTKALANKKCSYIIVYSITKLQDLKDWKIITQQKLNNNNNNYLSLMKKAILIKDDKTKFIKPTNNGNDLSIWKALETHNSSKDMIYIISRSEPLEGINVYVNEILQKYKSNKLRFLFILDSNAPDFDSNQTFYTNQLSKDLIVNIYKNGGWGSYKKIVLQDLKDDIKVNKNIVLKNFIANSKNKLNVKYLGLNFKDFVIEENTENEFGSIEYSGYIDNKTIMGITSFEKISSQMIYDPLLSWPIPSTWSLEEATTVPLAYAMNYYIFNVLCKLQKNNSILVTSGLHPIGQAAIAISLDMKCETYAIVNSDQQAKQLSSIFPELLRCRILINTNNTFDVHLNMITKSKGIDFILNFLVGESFDAAFRTLAKHGKFFNFSKTDMKNHRLLGTRIFLQNTSFFAISSSLLLNESIHNKKIVQQTLMDGLHKSLIKPFCSTVLTPPFSIDPILDDMRTALGTSNKIVLSLNDDGMNSKINFKRNSHQFHPNHVYVVVGNKSDWLDVAEWLVDRGAQKIVIVTKDSLISLTNCRRFDKLISQNVTIQFESFLFLKTKEESLEWLTRLTSSNVLGSMFIVNQHDDKIIKSLQNAFEKFPNKTKTTWLICISSKGEHICAELKSNGLNALNIHWDGISSQPNNIEKLLIALDNLLQKPSNIVSSSFICSESSAHNSKWSYQINDVITNFFPESIEELHLLHDKITKEAGFIEVPTRSPRLSQLKSVAPVFVIPGLKPTLVESFYRQFFYPVFEAQYPNDIISIDNLSEILVNKLKSITERGYVTIIGESWGGIVALKMAQILELQGIFVTLTLLEGDPEFLTGWAECFLSNDSFANKLNKMYSSLTNKHVSHNCEEVNKTLNTTSLNKILEDKTKKALNIIRNRLQILLESKPLLNKLHTKVLIVRYERAFEFYIANLNEYCTNPSFVHVIPKMDYKSMIVDRETINTITNNVVISYPLGIELPLIEKYNNFYFSLEKFLKHIS